MIDSNLSGDFAVDLVWAAIQAQLIQDLGNGVDVDSIGAEDFDEEGQLTIFPPAARVLFMEETQEPLEMQNLSYNADQRFAVVCAAQDLSPDPQARRDAALALARQVKNSLTGARLVLSDGHLSEPIRYTGMKPMPTADLGMAYVPAFTIQGVASFAGPNAQPQSPGAFPTNQEGEDNA